MQHGTPIFEESQLKSHLSFKPLIAALKRNISNGNPGVQKLYGRVVAEFESHQDLMGDITDLAGLEKHNELIEELLAAVFPPTASSQESMYAVVLPFKFSTIYTSKLFHRLFLKPGTNEVNIPEDSLGKNLNSEKFQYAVGMILKKYCGYNHPETTGSVHPFTDTVTGLTKYLELEIDARFIDVNPESTMPKMPDSIVWQHSNRIKTIEELMEQVPIDKFIFEGISIVRVNDVTESEVISRIKNSLLNINAFSDDHVYTELETLVQSLIGIKGSRIGITPFFKVNGHYVFSDLHNTNSLLFKGVKSTQSKDEISDGCKLLFRDYDQPLLFTTLDEQSMADSLYLEYYFSEGGRSLIICPLKLHGELLGILEVMSDTPGTMRTMHVAKMQQIVPLFTLGLEKSQELLDTQIDKVIKSHFTAVQPAVEWKFTEAALNFIVNRHQDENVKIERISFPNVYPLYGSLDIRNSSTERSHAIQLDLLEQLELARKVVKKVQSDAPFPLLQEVEFKIDKFISSASNVLLSDEEINIHDFMQGQVASIFNHLHSNQPGVKNEIEHYFSSLDPQIGMVYKHRKEYEMSVSRVNDVLARFIDREQIAAQKVYPHYFERYVTDGLEFNIYIGQLLTPRKKFDEIYLRNLKMWQLTMMAKATRLTHELEKSLSHPLRTTQLILSHSIPLSISFRTEERKFDVDGAYNIRYEIVKKRIDKVRIKETNERLTQPCKIAIVYSQAKDATEYMEYIEFLQNQNLLKPGIEKHDLEELQGVIGLKALRVEVNMEVTPVPGSSVELSTTTSGQLLN